MFLPRSPAFAGAGQAVPAADRAPPLNGSEVGMIGGHVADVNRRRAHGVEARLQWRNRYFLHRQMAGPGQVRSVTGGLAERSPDRLEPQGASPRAKCCRRPERAGSEHREA